MGIRIWNEQTEHWELQTSLHATSIAVRDPFGNFKNTPKTVESCLEETQQTINNLKKDIKYIYENGTIGGGGGGGGAFPKLELSTPQEIIVKTKNPFTISYFFNSPNPGDGTANYVISKKNSIDPPILDIKKTIRQGKNSQTFDPLPSGEYELSISVIDSTGIGSNNLVCSITCGALELVTNEETSRDVRLGERIKVTYTINSIFKENINVKITKPDGTFVQETKTPGTYSVELPPFEGLGVKNLLIQASYNDVVSNDLGFTFIVTDATTMFISSNFKGGRFRTDENISINYRISLLGARQFLTDIYVNDQLHEANIISKSGHNFYVLNNLPIGNYRVKFKSKTLESVNPIKAELEVPSFEVISSEFRTYKFSKDSLVLSLDARKGKSNNQELSKRIVWEDTEPDVPVRTTLHNFAFNFLNGWVPKSNEDLSVEGLKFGGKSYATIDLKPLENNLVNGLTFEVRYKSLDIGADKDGKYSCIVDCFNGTKNTGKGFMIDSKEAFLRTSYADSIYNEYNNDEWVTQTFVINTKDKELVLYTNGAISSYSKFVEGADLLIPKKITLGARATIDGVISENANCLIQTVRLYNRALDDLEVFKNYVSDLPLAKQDEIIAIQEGQLQIPTLKLKFDESALGNASATTTVDIEYSDPSDPSKNIILYNSIIQKQGTTSQTYPVSNYTIKLYDAGLPYDYSPKDEWIPENIFTLKADYMDSSHANNTGIASYATEVFNRLGIKNPAQKENNKVKNTIDGFMINLYVNGTNRGLYNFNTDRYGAKNYGLSNTKFKNDALSYEANSNTGNATGFHTQNWDLIKGAFKVRYFKNENDSNKYMTYDPELGEMVMTQGVHTEFFNLIKWINDAGSDVNKRFYSEFKEHLDLNHTLLYMLIAEIFGLMDNFEKNMVLTYFGEQYNEQTGMLDEVWYPQLYDLDSSVGLSNNGELKYQPCVNFTQEPGMPADHQYNGTKSLLWSGMKKHFFKELKDMYAQMRRTGLLSFETLVEYYQGKTIDKVSPYLFSVDARLKYINPSATGGKDTYYHFCKGRRIEFTKKWLKSRIQFLDSIYEYGNENNPDGNFWKYIQARYLKRNPEDTYFTLKAKSTTPIFVVVVDDSMKTDGKKYFISNDKFYNITIPINSSADGAMFGITFGPNITELKFSDNVRLSSLYLEHAKSLYELDLSGNKDLTSIVLNNCDNLRSFNVNGCTKLGSSLGSEKINFTNCPNIKNIDISNTSLSGFLVNDKGGIIETLNCNRSNIETFMLKNQPYIDSLNIVECNNLKKFELMNCERATSVNLPSSVIDTFRVLDCPNITSINISNTPFLNGLIDQSDPERKSKFYIDNCPKLTKIIMSGLSNVNMTSVDLINVENIEYLDISRCSYLSEVRFSEASKNLSTFICHNSSIKNFKIGRAGSTVDYLDLGHFPKITNANFDNCQNLREIRNSTLGKEGAIDGSCIFRNCSELTTIKGSLRLKGTMFEAFYNCKKLVSLPDNINFDEVYAINEAFKFCEKLTLQEAKRIMSKLPNVNGSTWAAFAYCKSFVSNNDNPFPNDFFVNNSKMTQINEMFIGIPTLTGDFPNELYKYTPNVTYIRQPFNGSKLEIPLLKQDDILSYMPNLITLEMPFAGAKFMKCPSKTFLSRNPKLKTIKRLFYSQSDMIKSSDSGSYFISEDFFANNTELSDLSYVFYDNQALIGKLPERLFVNNKKISNIEYIFYNVPITGPVSSILLPTDMSNGIKISYLTNTRYAFYNTEIDGIIENELLLDHNKVTDMSYMFGACKNLGTNIDPLLVKFPNRIFRNKKALTTIEGMFSDCTNYAIYFDSNNPDDNQMFSDNTNLTNISKLFKNDINLSGTLSEDMFNIKNEENQYIPNKIIRAEEVFYGCKLLGGRIPHNLFKSFFNVQNLNGFFYMNLSLEGGLPADLFENCYKLVSINNFLTMSWDEQIRKFGTNRDNTVEKYIDEATGFAYAFNKNLFANCTKLEDVSNFLYSVGHQFTGKIHEESFIGNPELKFINCMFTNSGIECDVNKTLFMRNKKLTNLSQLFRSSKGPINIHEDFISNKTHNYVHRDQNGSIVPKDFGGAFGNSNVTGTTPKLWEMYPNAVSSSSDGVTCFKSANLTNIEEVPITWK